MRPVDERTAVDDANIDGLLVAEVGDAHACTEREGAMRRGQALHVVNFSIGCGAAMVGVAIPTGEARFGGPNLRRRRHGGDRVVSLRASREQQHRDWKRDG